MTGTEMGHSYFFDTCCVSVPGLMSSDMLRHLLSRSLIHTLSRLSFPDIQSQYDSNESILVSENIITKPPLLTHIFRLCVRRCMPVVLNSLLKCRSSSHTLWISLSSSATRCTRSASFRGPKSWKSVGAKSGPQEGGGRTVHPTVATASLVRRPVGGLMLSCGRTT